MTYIYGLRDPNTGRFYYVGLSWNPEYRLYDHIHSQHNQSMHRWILALKQLSQTPELVILEPITGGIAVEGRRTRATHAAFQAEQRWIADLKAQGHPLINAIPGRRRRY